MHSWSGLYVFLLNIEQSFSEVLEHLHRLWTNLLKVKLRGHERYFSCLCYATLLHCRNMKKCTWPILLCCCNGAKICCMQQIDLNLFCPRAPGTKFCCMTAIFCSIAATCDVSSWPHLLQHVPGTKSLLHCTNIKIFHMAHLVEQIC